MTMTNEHIQLLETISQCAPVCYDAVRKLVRKVEMVEAQAETIRRLVALLADRDDAENRESLAESVRIWGAQL